MSSAFLSSLFGCVRFDRVRILAVFVVSVAMVVAPQSAGAQRATISVDVLNPSEALTMLSGGDPLTIRGASRVISAAFSQDDSTEAAMRIGNHGRYTDPQREELLRSLEQIAGGGSGLTLRSVMAAHATLVGILHPQAPTPARWKREIPGALLRIFHESQDGVARALAVSSMGDALGLRPREAQAIAQALYEVAAAVPRRSSGAVAPSAAVNALMSAGEAGVPTLRRLHEEGAVKDAMLAARLRILAEQGYPVQRRWPAAGN